jgi:hypothetical protein
MIEGSGSGSRRPKNTWIRIRIRIRNTDANILHIIHGRYNSSQQFVRKIKKLFFMLQVILGKILAASEQIGGLLLRHRSCQVVPLSCQAVPLSCRAVPLSCQAALLSRMRRITWSGDLVTWPNCSSKSPCVAATGSCRSTAVHTPGDITTADQLFLVIP